MKMRQHANASADAAVPDSRIGQEALDQDGKGQNLERCKKEERALVHQHLVPMTPLPQVSCQADYPVTC